MNVIEYLVNNFTVFNAVAIVIGVIVVAFGMKLPEYLQDKFRKRDARSLKAKEYHKEFTGKDLSDLLDKWYRFLPSILDEDDDSEEKYDPKKLRLLVIETQKVASASTNLILTAMLQHSFQGHGTKQNTENVETTDQVIGEESTEIPDKDNPDAHYAWLIFIAKLIDSLKFDFSGERLGAMLILQSTMNDFHEHDSDFYWANQHVKEDIKQTKKGARKPTMVTVKLICIVVILALLIGGCIYLISKL